jgi:hypothetical protein
MAKPKKKKVESVVEDDAIAVLAPLNGDRYKSKYASWNDFVMAKIPEDRYPTMHSDHLTKQSKTLDW